MKLLRELLGALARLFDPDTDFGDGPPGPCRTCGRIRRDRDKDGDCLRCWMRVW
jgi:hypothetical protein